jgi:hypothetical protein
MPKYPFESPLLKNLTYIREESPVKPEESEGGSEFGGYPSLEHRTNSFDIKESMTVHCGYASRLNPVVSSSVIELYFLIPVFIFAGLLKEQNRATKLDLTSMRISFMSWTSPMM